MKKIFFWLIAIVTFGFTSVNAQIQPYIHWEKTFGGSDDEEAKSFFLAKDGSCVIVGYSESTDGDVHNNHGGKDYWLVKLNRYYDTLWTKSLGGTAWDWAEAIDGFNDSTYIVAGYTQSTDGDVHGNHGGDDYWVVKLDAQGDTLWTKTLGGSSSDQVFDVKITKDGNCILVGSSSSDDGDVHGNHGNTDFWVVKLSAQGDILWSKSLGGSSADQANGLEITDDGNYIVVGSTYSNDGDVYGYHGGKDYWVVKLDTQGNIIWSKTLGGSQTDAATSVSLTTDGGYIVAGYTYSDDGDVHDYHGSYDEWIVKLDAQGNILWSKTLGGSNAEYSSSVTLTKSGDYIIAGHSRSTDGDVYGNHGSDDFWIVKLNDQGDTLWTKSLGGSGWEGPHKIIETQDRSYLITGVTYSEDGDVSYNHGNYDYWMVKLREPSCLLGDYPFDGNAYDESGNLNDGDSYGVESTRNRFEQKRKAYYFSNYNDSIVIPHGANNISKGAISVWLVLYNSTDTFPVFNKPLNPSGIDLGLEIFEGKAIFSLSNTHVESDSIIQEDKWTHIVCSWDGDNMFLYVNGKLQSTNSNSNGTVDDSSVNLVVGSNETNLAHGSIDDFQIYNCTLDSEKVDSLYHLNGWDLYKPFTNECITFDDNKIPEHWWLAYDDTAFVENGKLISQNTTSSTNSVIALIKRLGSVPEGTDSLIIQWEGNVLKSDPYYFTGVEIVCGDTNMYFVHYQSKTYDYGMLLIEDRNGDVVFIQKDSTEIQIGVYKNTLVFTNNDIYFTAFQKDNPAEQAFSLNINPFEIDSTYLLKKIRNLSMLIASKEEIGYNWIDDICIRLVEKSAFDQSCEMANYKLDNNLLDNSGNGYYLSEVNGPLTFVKDRFGEDNKSVYLSAGQFLHNDDIAAITGDFSLSTWVYPDTYTGTDTSLIFFNSFYDGDNALMIGVLEASQKVFFGHVVNGNLQVETSDILLPASIWTHLVLNRDSINKKYTLYVNGKKSKEFVYTEQPVAHSDAFISMSTNDNNFQYKGCVDDVKLWHCQIDSQQVDSLYHFNAWPRVMCQDMNINITTEDASCGENNGEAQVTASGGSGYYIVDWSNGDKGFTTDSLSAGSHSVQVSDSIYGCMSNRFFNIDNTNAPSIAIDKTDLTCYNEATGAISANITGGNPPYIIEWSTGENTQDIQDLSAGNYFITVTDTSHCMTTQSVEIIQPTAIQTDFTIYNSTCGNADGAITANVSGGTPPYSYLWNIDSTKASITNLEAGNYILSVEDNNHCKTSFTTVFSDEGAPEVIIDSIHSAGCGEQGGIFVSVSGGSGTYNYEWSNGEISQNLDGFEPGEYWLKITDGSCTNMLNAIIPYIYPKQPSICMVTVDTATATNLIVWDRGNDQYVDHYNIYREGYAPDEYLLVESVDADDITEYNDTVASPYKRSWRYKISAEDACGNETVLSDNHKTIHLNMNTGLAGSFNLIWDDYEGFDYNIFYIYRKQANIWTLIDSLPSNLHSYTDTPPSDKGLWYIVTIHTKEACMSTSRDSRASGGPYYQSTSNLEDDGIANNGDEPSSIQNLYQDIQIYPNPTKGQIIVQGKGVIRVEVSIASGQKIRDVQSYSDKLNISLENEAKGLYFVKVITKQGVILQKIVLE